LLQTTTVEPKGLLAFQAANVTGTQQIPVEVRPGSSVSDVTTSLVDIMSLPDDIPWALRDDGSSVYLDDARPIGEQLKPGSRVTITPRAHLGGAAGARG
jgi:hypothetical protein